MRAGPGEPFGDFQITTQIVFTSECEAQRTSRRKTKAELARQVLLHKQGFRENASVPLEFRVHCLKPEKLRAVFAESFERATHERMFQLCSLTYASCRTADTAQCERLSHTDGLTTTDKSLAVHLLETARYTEQTSRYTTLKSAFYFLFIILSIPSWRERLRYSRDLLLQKSLRLRLFLAVRGAIHHFRKPSLRPAYPFAYWLESASAQPTKSTHIYE
jgi:hypothetical protein